MPCKPDTLIFTLFKCEFEKGIIEVPASNPDKWKWQEIDDDYSIIGWRFATPPQEKGELTILRIRLEDAETVIEDIASDVAEFAADGDSPNAGPRDRLAAKVFSHISAHRASAPDSKLSWKDKQVAGLEESLRAAKERMLKDEAELTRLREAIKGASLLPDKWRNVNSPSVIYSRCAQDLEAVLHLFQPFTESK